VSTLPSRLWVVRHGESAGNVAWSRAESAGEHWIDVTARDADVPLSDIGERQAAALGAWFAEQPESDRPTVILASPYARAHRTAQIVGEAIGGAVLVDERLREKEFGALNRMTRAGIVALMPEQAELRKTLGKFYYRPPGGESWCDIALRVRSLWQSIRLDHPGERVLLVCHTVVTLCFRYVVEGLDEAGILEIDASSDVANCSVTAYVCESKKMVLERFNFTAPVAQAGEPVTRGPDAPRPK
jgi:probable phosphoglycerate mutase